LLLYFLIINKRCGGIKSFLPNHAVYFEQNSKQQIKKAQHNNHQKQNSIYLKPHEISQAAANQEMKAKDITYIETEMQSSSKSNNSGFQSSIANSSKRNQPAYIRPQSKQQTIKSRRRNYVFEIKRLSREATSSSTSTSSKSLLANKSASTC
jgi:hypothetical protein